MDLWVYEREQWSLGYTAVCGLDEAGAGPLAGAVYAAAVILPPDAELPGLNDSKKLSAKQRGALFEMITAQARAYRVAWADETEIDELNILNASILAMKRALNGLSVTPDFCLIDGNRDRGSVYAIETPHKTIVRGDAQSASIAAASILAKVSRDRYVIQELDTRYPQYHFAQHKGYGTRLHYEMLDLYGSCPAHRSTYLRKWRARTGR